MMRIHNWGEKMLTVGTETTAVIFRDVPEYFSNFVTDRYRKQPLSRYGRDFPGTGRHLGGGNLTPPRSKNYVMPKQRHRMG